MTTLSFRLDYSVLPYSVLLKSRHPNGVILLFIVIPFKVIRAILQPSFFCFIRLFLSFTSVLRQSNYRFLFHLSEPFLVRTLFI